MAIVGFLKNNDNVSFYLDLCMKLRRFLGEFSKRFNPDEKSGGKSSIWGVGRVRLETRA